MPPEYGYLGGEKAVGSVRGKNMLMEMWIAPLPVLGGNYNLLMLIIFIFKKNTEYLDRAFRKVDQVLLQYESSHNF